MKGESDTMTTQGPPFDALDADALGAVLAAATYYAVGRSTVMPSSIASVLVQTWDSLPEDYRRMVRSRIFDAASLGESFDQIVWQAVIDMGDGLPSKVPNFLWRPLESLDAYHAAFCTVRAYDDGWLPADNGPAVEAVAAGLVMLRDGMTPTHWDSIVQQMMVLEGPAGVLHQAVFSQERNSAPAP